MTSDTSTEKKKPGLSIFLATACGLGYLPKAPGTWGSLGGILVTMFPYLALYAAAKVMGGIDITISSQGWNINPLFAVELAMGIAIAAIGVWTATRAASYWGEEDPQKVVIDEVSGQQITLVLGCALPVAHTAASAWQAQYWGLVLSFIPLNWKYLVVGFILFRVFDIWKPFPARQFERLHGGWGIMADDWMAGIYAAIGLWIARAAGL